MTAQHEEDSVGAFTGAHEFRDVLGKRYGKKNIRDYSREGAYAKKDTDRANHFIASIEQYLSDPINKNKPILIHIGFHGNASGNTGPFNQEHI